MTKIIGKHWFTGQWETGVIGIIVVETEVGERKAYIGSGTGVNENSDARRIADYGSPVMKASLEQILKEFK